MSLPFFIRRLTASERSRLDEILREPPNVRVFLRAKAVDLSSRGWKVHEVAEAVERDRSVVSRWLHRFEDQGIDAVWPKKSSGRPPKVTPEFRNAVDESARQNPRDVGYDFTRWTADLMAEHLASTTGIRIAAGTLRGILGDLGFHWGRPKLDLKHRQDPQDVARAKRLRSGALKKR
jgi:transposase